MAKLNQTFSNVTISQPIAHPELELYPMSGFAWSNQGVIHQTTSTNTGSPETWFGNN